MGSASLGSPSSGSASLGSACVGSACVGSACVGSACVGSATVPVAASCVPPEAPGGNTPYEPQGAYATFCCRCNKRLQPVHGPKARYLERGSFPEPSDCSGSRDREGAVAGHATITVFGPLAHARGSVGLDGSWSRCATTLLPSTLSMNRHIGTRDSPGSTAPLATPCRLNPAFRARGGSWSRSVTSSLSSSPPTHAAALFTGPTCPANGHDS